MQVTEKGKLLRLLLCARKENEGLVLDSRQVVSLIVALMGGDADCETCRVLAGGMAPSHDGSKGCESGSISSGGDRAHCTCDVCF